MPCDLEKVIQDTTLVLSQADVKGYMQQLFVALEHCHANYVVHRDVKVGWGLTLDIRHTCKA